MQTRLMSSILFSPLLLCLTATFSQSQSAPAGQVGPTVIRSAHHAISPPLRSIPPIASTSTQPHVIPLHRPPAPSAPHFAPGTDWALQGQSSSQSLAGNANFGSNFDGVGDGFPTFNLTGAPPDTNGAVGATQYVQSVNESFAVFDKNTGQLLYGAADISTLFQSLSGSNCALQNESDPIVLYDKLANRWLISIIDSDGGNPTHFSMCIAVSTTSDATGSYNLYDFSTGTVLPDYPKFGAWPDAYYFTADGFDLVSGAFADLDCAFDRAAMLAGQALQSVCFQNPSIFAMMPSDLDGTNPPPTGEPNFFVGLGSTITGDNTSLLMFKFHVDFATPANSTFTGPTTISVAPYSPLCNNSDAGQCVPQLQSTQLLDSLNFTPMFRLAYRNLGTGKEYLVVNHSVDATGSGGAATGGVRWYQIQDPNGTSGGPTVAQQGTFAPADTSWRWMGSVAMDSAGDIGVGYSESSSIMFPAIAVTAQMPSDPANTFENETMVFEGSGSQQPDLNRWGDYSAITVDPVDDCTFWFTTEYIPSNGAFNWHTRIVSFKMNNCTPPGVVQDFLLTSSPGTLTITPGSSGTSTISVTPENGFSGTVNLSVAVTGSPTGVTASLNPTSVSGSGSSTLTVNTTNSTPGGNFPIVITASSAGITHTAYVTLATPGFVLASSNSGNVFVNQGGRATNTITISAINGFSGNVKLSASQLPSGVTASFSPNPATSTSTLTLTATSTAPTQSLTPIVVTGTSGNLTQNLNVNVAVSAAIHSGGAGNVANLSRAFNVNGIYKDGSTFSNGGLDNSGFVYSSNLLTPNRTLNGLIFVFGPANQRDAVSGTGAPIALPAGYYTTLQMLATGVNGNQTSQPITVTYTDGTNQQFTQSFSDWFTPQHYPGESEGVAMPYRDFSGGKDTRPFNLYAYSFHLNSSKTVQSITLPNNRNLVVLAITLQ